MIPVCGCYVHLTSQRIISQCRFKMECDGNQIDLGSQSIHIQSDPSEQNVAAVNSL